MAILGNTEIQEYNIKNTEIQHPVLRNTTSPSYDGHSKHEGGVEISGNMGNTEI